MDQPNPHFATDKKRPAGRLRRQPFLIKLQSWEYWPYQLIYIPIYFYWLWLSLRARSLFFFSLANPAIPLGGLMGESKFAILQLFPEELIPKTVLIRSATPLASVLLQIEAKGISFPLIAKPDIGERGFLVEKIATPQQLLEYIFAHRVDIIVQEYIDFPEEISVLYYRFPEQAQGHITSVTLKEFLQVRGDGHSTLQQLILDYPRALLQWERLSREYCDRMQEVIPAGEVLILVPIGNHSRGATFLNGNHLIDEALVAAFDQISHRVEGIYFGRFDLRCKNIGSLRRGEDFCILELNGVKAEPTHIYEPGYSIWKAYSFLFRQWKIIYQLSRANRRRGYEFMTLREVVETIMGFHRYRRLAKAQVANG